MASSGSRVRSLQQTVALITASISGPSAGATTEKASRSANARSSLLWPLPSLAKRCSVSDVRATTFRFKARDGVLLDGAVLGRSPVGIVLAHEAFGDLCRWVPYGKLLSQEGFRVLVFDYRGFGLSAKVTGRRCAHRCRHRGRDRRATAARPAEDRARRCIPRRSSRAGRGGVGARRRREHLRAGLCILAWGCLNTRCWTRLPPRPVYEARCCSSRRRRPVRPRRVDRQALRGCHHRGQASRRRARLLATVSRSLTIGGPRGRRCAR